MRCIYCGAEAGSLLCSEYRDIAVLDELLEQMAHYSPERCGNSNIANFIEGFDTARTAYKEAFPKLLALFDDGEIEYERCRYLGDVKDGGFETAAESYLASRGWHERRSQVIMRMLLKSYDCKEFYKPAPYVEFISETTGLLFELYLSAITYKGRIGDYDDAVRLAEFARDQMKLGCPSCFGRGLKEQTAALDKACVQNEKWRAKRYWPRKNAEAQAQLSELYKTKGITPGYVKGASRSTMWPAKVAPSDFKAPVRVESAGDDFCAVWLRCVPGYQKSVCEIIVAKIRDGEWVDEFQSLVRLVRGFRY